MFQSAIVVLVIYVSSIMESALVKMVWTKSEFHSICVLFIRSDSMFSSLSSENRDWIVRFVFDCSGFGFYVDEHGNMVKKPQVSTPRLPS